MGTFHKFGGWRTETFSEQSETQTSCDMAVIDTIQWVFMEMVWLFNVTPLFNVAPLDGILRSFKIFLICFVSLNGYLHYKTIFCHKGALDLQLMNFFIWSKNNVSFSRYLDFCVFVKSTDFEICDVIINIAT